ncbi:hypothetical protein JTB14_033206 [Gonioctena quinquepunctata]|nr:hypothetical protein JTB14_033206 [Gonioctena quinquepunctata]
MEDNNLSSPSHSLRVEVKSTLDSVLEDYKIIDEVRIIPAKIIFRDAYDGKNFKQSLKIINAGKYPALVRLFPPTSQAFKMHPLPKGETLPSGMSIVRNMYYTYTSAMAIPQACLSIYINEKLVIYDIEVHISAPCISLSPKILDFGEVDVGTASQQMVLELKNSGHKLGQFVVDLGRNAFDLIVHPMKGIVEPMRSVEIKVELLGTQEGTFMKEFWIKTEPPQRGYITGKFILANLVIEHPITIFDLTVIDFPRTYYGAQNKRTLVVQNNSSRATMFCTVAEAHERLIDDNLKCFYITPKEGRLMAKHKYILGVSFIPKRMKTITQNYCMTFLRILRINYRDGLVEDKDIKVTTFSSVSELDYTIVSHENIQTTGNELNMMDTCLRVCLYGEIEEAAVEIKPNAFDINDLVEGQICIRTFNVKNKSKNLPIIMKHYKVACIEFEPEEIDLEPDGNVDVLLSIRPKKIGFQEHKLILKLLYRSRDNMSYEVGSTFIYLRYATSSNQRPGMPKANPKYNMGITPIVTNEVGFLVDDVRYNTEIKKPLQAIVDEHFEKFHQNNSHLIAFPNDRARSLRPWRSEVPCTTIYANIPRYFNKIDEYTLTDVELDKKKRNRLFYAEYLKTRTKQVKTFQPVHEALIDYEVTGKTALMIRKSPWRKCSTEKFKIEGPSLFIPIPPEKLMNVQITPRYIQLGMIAPYTSCTDFFTIENKNDFAINISIKALSNSVVIKGKKQITISAFEGKNIYFDCYSHGLGKYYVPVYIIVNECHIFDATVFAEVVPTTVRCAHKEVTICSNTHDAFFEIFNPVNCDIEFNWEVLDKNYTVVPKKGVVPPRKNLYCRVTFKPQIDATFTTEIYLLSQSGAKQIVRVLNKNKKAEVAFNTRILNFGNIPLNTSVTKHLIVRNFSEENITVVLSHPDCLQEVRVSPTGGILHANSDMCFKVTIHFRAVFAFNWTIIFVVQDEYSHEIKLHADVRYPHITLQPDQIQIHKIETGALYRQVLKVTNNGTTGNFVSFPFENIPAFTLVDSERNIMRGNVPLEPGETKELSLEFEPSEPTAYSFYLPYVLNGLIGPPLLNNPETLAPRNYLDKFVGFSDSKKDCPSTIPIVRVKCAAGGPWFKFSSKRMEFHFRKDQICEGHFKIQNISSLTHFLVLSVSGLKKPFSVSLEECEGTCETNAAYHKVTLQPEQKVGWLFTYSPTTYGTAMVNLPILVGAFLEKTPFNFLRLSGSYCEPEIICNPLDLIFPDGTCEGAHFQEDQCEVVEPRAELFNNY